MGRRNLPTEVFKHIDMTATECFGSCTTPCWPWTGSLSGNGRPYFTVDGKKVLAYALSYELVTGKKAEKGQVYKHKCDNEICCRWDHVEPGSHQENMNEMKERARHGLPHHTVRAIRKLGSNGVAHAQIAELYGIGRSTVTEIINRDNYQHVKDEEDEST